MMATNNRPVDVLAVLDRAIASRPVIAVERAKQGREGIARDLIAARAAVAELIEAHRKIAALPYQRAATNGCAYEAVAISRAALAHIERTA